MSSQYFTPGNKSYAKKMINYNSVYNQFNTNLSSSKNCFCIPNKYNKYVLSSDSASSKLSNNIRISQIIKYSKGGKIQYGNFYLGQQLNINYLGKIEGMPGGSGSPPSNF
jgi:hypothetical protein